MEQGSFQRKSFPTMQAVRYSCLEEPDKTMARQASWVRTRVYGKSTYDKPICIGEQLVMPFSSGTHVACEKAAPPTLKSRLKGGGQAEFTPQFSLRDCTVIACSLTQQEVS